MQGHQLQLAQNKLMSNIKLNLDIARKVILCLNSDLFNGRANKRINSAEVG